MMYQPVDEGSDAGGAWENGGPILESEIGGNDDGFAFVSPGEDSNGMRGCQKRQGLSYQLKRTYRPGRPHISQQVFSYRFSSLPMPPMTADTAAMRTRAETLADATAPPED